MSPVKNNVGRGLNIALVNGELLTHPQSAPACPSAWLACRNPVLSAVVARPLPLHLPPLDTLLL